MDKQVKAITIDKLEFEGKCGKAVANSMNRMDRCIRGGKAAESGDFMGMLAVTVFHMKETAKALQIMSEKIFKDGNPVTITEMDFDMKAVNLLEMEAKGMLQIQEDGQYKPMPVVVAGAMAWNLAFQELRRVLFEEETSKEDEIFRSARESIRRETEKPLKDYEMNAMKFKADGPVNMQTTWANTEASQSDAASAPAPEQTGTENLERAQMDKAIEKIKECDFSPDAKEASEISKDPGFRSTVENLEKRRTFLGHIRQRFGF